MEGLKVDLAETVDVSEAPSPAKQESPVQQTPPQDEDSDVEQDFGISVEEEALLVQAFATIDFDAGGSISFDELTQAFT